MRPKLFGTKRAICNRFDNTEVFRIVLDHRGVIRIGYARDQLVSRGLDGREKIVSLQIGRIFVVPLKEG